MNQAQQSTNRNQDQSGDFASSRRRILVVEDDPDISHLLDIHLRDNAFQVDVVDNGIDGLARATSLSYQLIVLDLMLPGIDGLELCREIKVDENP